MKPSLLFATLSLVLASPQVFAKSELELLRARCKEQERQIQQLEEEKARLTGNPEVRSKPKPVETVSSAIAKTDSPAATSAGSYAVKAGDSFAKIARKVGTTPEKLAKENGLKVNSVIQPGQNLKVPVTTAKTSSPAPASQPKPEATEIAANGRTHKIQQGETFTTISKKYGINTSALIAANPTVKPTTLRPGQVLNLSGSAAGTSTPVARAKAPVVEPKAIAKTVPKTMTVSTAAPKSEPKPVSKSEPKPAPAPTAAPAAEPAAKETPAPKSDKKIRPIIVDGEITYGEFAAKHGTDADRLNALNGLDLTTATVLAKGSELYVPAQP